MYKELRTLGFEIPEPELSSASFGMGTREAVVAFQNSHGLSPYDSMIRKYARQRLALPY